MDQKKLVVIESPYAGDVARNLAYAQRCLRYALLRGVVPIASHVFYTSALDDDIPAERELGMIAGWELARHASECWVFADLGISQGMKEGIALASRRGQAILYRRLDG